MDNTDGHLSDVFRLPYVVQSWVHSFLPYIQLLLVWSYLNSMLLITYVQMIYKFMWNLTLGTLILVPLNWQIALRPSSGGWEITEKKKTEIKSL